MSPDAVDYVLLAEDVSNYGRRAFFFAGPYVWNSLSLRRALRLELTSWAYPAININGCLQALTEDISTPADIAPSALETIISYCFMAYIISALTYYFELCAHCLSSTY